MIRRGETSFKCSRENHQAGSAVRAFGRTGADSPDDEADDSPCDPVRVHPKSPDDQADSPDDHADDSPCERGFQPWGFLIATARHRATACKASSLELTIQETKFCKAIITTDNTQPNTP